MFSGRQCFPHFNFTITITNILEASAHYYVALILDLLQTLKKITSQNLRQERPYSFDFRYQSPN